MYIFIDTEAGDISLGSHNALPRMNQIAPSWKKHSTEWGNLFTESHEWAVAVDELGEEVERKSYLRNGVRLRYNEFASRFFNMEIYGTCVVNAFLDRNAELGTAIKKAKGDSRSSWH